MKPTSLPLAFVFTAPLAAQVAEAEAPTSTVAIRELDGKLRVEIGGKLVTEYHYRGFQTPILHPLIGPTGKTVTRDWPMKDSDPDEAHDHPHHQSLWFTHGSVNGFDFWHKGSKRSGQLVHRKFAKIECKGKVGTIVAHNDWLGSDGQVTCTDVRTLRFHDRGEGLVFDYEIEMRASHGPLRFGDTKEGSMAIRVKPTLRVRGDVAKGHLANSEGVEGKKVWGKRAVWVDAWGPLAGETVGIAIFDHPENHAHPTWWHARDYGLIAANPFGVHDFERKPAGAGDLQLAKGERLTQRYRFYLHRGDPKTARVAEMYAEYAGEANKSGKEPHKQFRQP